MTTEQYTRIEQILEDGDGTQGAMWDYLRYETNLLEDWATDGEGYCDELAHLTAFELVAVAGFARNTTDEWASPNPCDDDYLG